MPQKESKCAELSSLCLWLQTINIYGVKQQAELIQHFQTILNSGHDSRKAWTEKCVAALIITRKNAQHILLLKS